MRFSQELPLTIRTLGMSMVIKAKLNLVGRKWKDEQKAEGPFGTHLENNYSQRTFPFVDILCLIKEVGS